MFARNHLVLATRAPVAALSGWTRKSVVLLGRLFWVSLLLIHASAFAKLLRAACGSQALEAEIIGCVWLTVAMAFFVLKAFGVPWLRFRTDRRSQVAILTAILLIHSGPLGLPLASVLAPTNMPLLGALVLAATLDQVHQWCRATTGSRTRRIPGRLCESRSSEGAAVLAPPLSPLIVWAPRPPPRSR
jgi:hypothetical protein